MTTYRISNRLSGATLGSYEADSPDGALEAMAREAGYADYAQACEAAPVQDGEIVVSEVDITDEQIEQLRIEAGASGDDEQVELCVAALDGDDDARIECERVIREAAALAADDA